MTIYTTTGTQFSKAGIAVTYTDETGATATQNVTFANKVMSLDSGLNVTAGKADFAGAVEVHGAAQLDSTLDVTGAGRFRNALVVDGAFNMGSSLNVAGAATMGSTLAVTGATNLNSTLAVAGATNMAGTLAVNGNTQVNQFNAMQAAQMNSTLGVTGATSLASTLDVTGASRLRNTLLVDGAATMGSTLAVTGVANMNNRLNVTGDAHLNGNTYVGAGLEVTNDADMYGSLIVRQGFNARAASNLDGAVTAGSTLAVAGAASLNSSLAVAGATTLTGALDVKAASHLENTLLVDGATSLGAALTVTGAATMNNGMTVNGTSTHNGALVVSGAASVGGALAITGAATMNSAMNVKGASRIENVLVVDGAASLGSSLAVAGNSSLAGSLAVTGASVLTGALDVKAAAHLENTLLVDGAASLGAALTVTGASILNNTLAVSGAASMASSLAVTGAATLSSSLDVAGAASVVGAMDVTGASRLRNSAQIDGAATLGSTLAVTGAASLSNTLAVTGAASMASTLDVTGASRLRDNVVVDGTASMGSSLAVTGAASLASSLAVTGAANLNNTLAVTGAASLNNTLAVSGAASLASSLAVTGAASMNNTLAVTGAASLSNTLAVAGAASLNSSLAVTGAALMNNTLAVTGAATFQNNVTVNGNLTVLGSQTAIDTTSLQVKDNAILLADGNTADALQTGIQLQYKPSGAADVKYAGMKRLPQTGEFVFFKDSAKTIDDPSASESTGIPFIVSPQKPDISSNTWTQSGITYTSSASSQHASGNYPEYAPFNNYYGQNVVYSWASASTYTISSGAYAGSISTTVLGGVGAVAGEWVQLQLSAPMAMDSYSFACGSIAHLPRLYYIVGSNDGSAWYPVQYGAMSSNPFTVGFTTGGSAINVNQSGVQSIHGPEDPQTGSGNFTTYPTTGTKYSYYRLIANAIYGASSGSGGLLELNEWYINFLSSSATALPTSYTVEWTNLGGASFNNFSINSAVTTTLSNVSMKFMHRCQGYNLPAGTYSYSATARNDDNYWDPFLLINEYGATVVTVSTGVAPWSNQGPLTGTFTLAKPSMVYAKKTSNQYYAYATRLILNLTQTSAPAQAVAASDVYATLVADSFNCASDARLKKDVVSLDSALDKLDAIRGVHYHWVDASQPQSRQIGVIAQEIQAVYPELVREGGNGFLSVDYPKLTAVLIQSIKELKAMAVALMNK